MTANDGSWPGNGQSRCAPLSLEKDAKHTFRIRQEVTSNPEMLGILVGNLRYPVLVALVDACIGISHEDGRMCRDEELGLVEDEVMHAR